jgi:hypothetical protein
MQYYHDDALPAEATMIALCGECGELAVALGLPWLGSAGDDVPCDWCGWSTDAAGDDDDDEGWAA